MTNATVWRCPKCYGLNFSVPKPGCECAWCGYEIPKEEKDDADRDFRDYWFTDDQLKMWRKEHNEG